MNRFPVVFVLDSEDAQKYLAALGATRFGSLDNVALIEKLQYDLSRALNACDERIGSDFSLLNEAAKGPARMYRDHVKHVADDIREEIKDGEITSSERLEARIDEAVDVSWWVIYTWPAMWVPLVAEGADDAIEDYGVDDPEHARDPSVIASIVLRANLTENLTVEFKTLADAEE